MSNGLKQTILVLGATGNQGGAVARTLAGVGFDVRGAGRDASGNKAQALREAGVEPVAVDLDDPATLDAALPGAHGLYVVLPFYEEDHDKEVRQGRAAIDAAKRAGVRHLVYSAGARSNERTGVPHLDSKGEVERHLRASGLPATVLRPVAFNYSLAAYRDGAEQGTLPDPRVADSMVYQVSEHDFARLVALAFLEPSMWVGQSLDVASDALTVGDLAATFGRVLGRSVKHQRITWDEEEGIAGAEVVRLAKWVEAEGPRVDVETLRHRFPWLTRTEDYLRAAGWGATT